MEIIKFDIGEIADLAAPLAVNGAIHTASYDNVGMFDHVVDIVAIVYEMYPNG